MTLTEYSHETDDKSIPLWGVNICPACKGMGVLSAQDRQTSVYRIADYICPLCDFNRDPVRCRAWVQFMENGKLQWCFYLDEGCDEVRRIVKSLDSIRMKGNPLY